MKLRFALSLFAACALPAFGADYHLDLTPATTRIQFTLGDVLHTVTGTFALERGAIDFNPDNGKASGEIAVDVASGNSGSEARDRRMHANVLESSKYPEAVFTPDRIEGPLTIPGTSNVKLHGTFSIHGATHEVTLDVQATTTADQMHATIRFNIPYVAWGMKDPSNFLLKVNKTVQMSIDATAPIQTR